MQLVSISFIYLRLIVNFINVLRRIDTH